LKESHGIVVATNNYSVTNWQMPNVGLRTQTQIFRAHTTPPMPMRKTRRPRDSD